MDSHTQSMNTIPRLPLAIATIPLQPWEEYFHVLISLFM